jgi:hypothetical protein
MMKCIQGLLTVAAMVFAWLAGNAGAAPVDENVIRQVATNYIANHISVHGSWNGETSPSIAAIQLVRHEGIPVAYNVTVLPSGHLFMAYDDDFSPVLLYSPESSFDPDRIGIPDSPEAWIIPETHAVYQKLQKDKLDLAARDAAIVDQERSHSRSVRAWNFFNQPSDKFVPQSRLKAALNKDFSPDLISGAVASVDALLKTAWAQGSSTLSNYNLYTPAVTGPPACSHALTGCVATATGQLMKYWNWPAAGTGSHSYLSNSQTRSADFNHAYNWTSMPTTLVASSTSTQIDAVARLLSDAGVAADMNYGCSVSGAWPEIVAKTALPGYFKYKTGAQSVYRNGINPLTQLRETAAYTAPAFFAAIKAELDATPPRPMLFQMFTVDRTSGHAVVVDGYQTGTTDMVHINLGWGTSYNAFYDISNNWTSSTLTWDATSQGVFTHIEPDTAANCFPALSSSSQWANATGLTSSVSVTASSGCPWTASSNQNWITITSGATGSGNGTVSYTVAANVSTTSRTGALTIAGQSFTVSQAGSGGSASNLIVNPGFESGATAWTQSSAGGFPIITNEPSYAHAGSYDAWLGGYDSGNDFLYQKVTIPSNAQTATLQFWSKVSTSETGGLTYDWLTADLYNGTTGAYLDTLVELSNLDSPNWSLRNTQFDVSAYRGQSIYLGFSAVTDESGNTNFRIDDVSLTVSTGASSLPAAPAIGAVTAGNASVSVAFTPGSIGTGTLVNYWAACSSNNADYIFGSGSSSPITVSGLTNGTVYYCWALTRSTIGDGAWSSASSAVTPVGSSLPDLVVSALSSPANGVIGGQISMSATVLNQGAGSAGASRLGFYFSTDATITTGDTFSGTSCGMVALTPGNSQVCSGTVSIPATLAPGTYYFGAYADDLLEVGESDGGNNTRSAPISLTSPLTGMFWNASESGWGISVTQHGSMIFLTWYAYDSSGKPTWYVMSSCPLSGKVCSGDIYSVAGGTPLGVTWNGAGKIVNKAGTGTLTFADNDNATLAYALNGVTTSRKLTRQSIASGTTLPAIDYSDLWWNANESGWGVALTQQYTTIFATIYTYDASGKAIWYVASNCPVSGSACSAPLYQVTGCAAPTVSWTCPNKVVAQVGTVGFTFADSRNGTMSYTINGVTASKAITRQSF